MYGPIIDGWAALGDGDKAAKWLSQAEAQGARQELSSLRAALAVSQNLGCFVMYGLAGIELNVVLYNAVLLVQRCARHCLSCERFLHCISLQ